MPMLDWGTETSTRGDTARAGRAGAAVWLIPPTIASWSAIAGPSTRSPRRRRHPTRIPLDAAPSRFAGRVPQVVRSLTILQVARCHVDAVSRTHPVEQSAGRAG